MMHSYVIADVFTDVPLEGNQVAVFTDAAGLDEDADAAYGPGDEPLGDGVRVVCRTDTDTEADATIRIFTPTTELPFAGHPVLGTAFVLGSS